VAQTGLPAEAADQVRLVLQRRNRKLQPEQVDQLVVGYQAGTSLRGLAREFDLHEQTVRNHRLRRGVELRQTYVIKRWRKDEGE
jgi:hypothetical protein